MRNTIKALSDIWAHFFGPFWAKNRKIRYCAAQTKIVMDMKPAGNDAAGDFGSGKHSNIPVLTCLGLFWPILCPEWGFGALNSLFSVNVLGPYFLFVSALLGSGKRKTGPK